MSSLLRAILLSFVVLVEGLGSALAMAPVIGEPADEMAAMPCHPDGASKSAMPCCQDDLRCNINCFGSAPPLAPAECQVGSFEPMPLEASLRVGALPPADPERPLRPPADLLPS